jgi:hypothetical protein
MKKRTIRNADNLDREIYRRKLRLKEIESTLGKNVQELPGQIPKMALYAFLGSKQKPGAEASVSGQLMAMAMENEKLQSSLAELVDRIADKIGEGLQKLTHIILDREKDK